MEAEALAPRGVKAAPIAQRLLQQREGADDIGLDEFAGPVDRAVDMALGREVHHIARLVLIEQLPQRRPVADIDLREAVAVVALAPAGSSSRQAA